MAPAALRLTADQQVAWWRSVGDQVKVFLPVAAGLTILLGIARGIAGGVVSILGTPYGYTWIAALILGYSETAVAYLASTAWTELVSLVAVVATLMIRPSGIFGRRAAF